LGDFDMTLFRVFRILLSTLAVVSFALPRGAEAAAPIREIRWKKVVLDPKFRAEGASVADVNRDGKPDVMAGNIWYEAPDWKPHVIGPLENWDPATQYSNCFHSFAMDVDRDGWTDEILIGFPGAKGSWLKNPGRGGGAWTETVISGGVRNESPNFRDVNGDGSPDLVFGIEGNVMPWWGRDAQAASKCRPFTVRAPGAPASDTFSHGLGVGDVNGDGKADVLCPQGFWTAPADPKTGPWKFTAANLGPDCAHMYAYDFDGDGDMDVFSSSAHAIGVWWYEQVQGGSSPKFVQHTIDDTFSESHAVIMTDLNGDKQPDFITGKRWWAHGPSGDVNPNDPAVLAWYEFRRKEGKVVWTRHLIDSDSGVGTQFTVADVNRDGRPDIVIANKKGVFYFEQVRTGKARRK
jgi:hypothetical protein